MPFKSQAQQRAAFGGHLGPEMKKKAPEWAHETPNIKSLPKHVKEDSPMEEAPVLDHQWAHPGCEDTIGDLYVVLKPNNDSSAQDLVHKTHAFGMGQFDPHSVHGVYGDEGEAQLVAEGAVKDLHKHLTTVEKKKDMALSKIAKHVKKLQNEINGHMKEANARPEEADMHHQLAEKKMTTIKGLRDKHKVISASKKELPKKDKKEE